MRLFLIVKKELLERNWFVKVSHVYREANFVANSVANFAHTLPLGIHVYRESPPSLYIFVLR